VPRLDLLPFMKVYRRASYGNHYMPTQRTREQARCQAIDKCSNNTPCVVSGRRQSCTSGCLEAAAVGSARPPAGRNVRTDYPDHLASWSLTPACGGARCYWQGGGRLNSAGEKYGDKTRKVYDEADQDVSPGTYPLRTGMYIGNWRWCIRRGCYICQEVMITPSTIHQGNGRGATGLGAIVRVRFAGIPLASGDACRDHRGAK